MVASALRIATTANSLNQRQSQLQTLLEGKLTGDAVYAEYVVDEQTHVTYQYSRSAPRQLVLTSQKAKSSSSSRGHTLKAATLVTTLVKGAPIQGYTTLNGRRSVAYFSRQLTARTGGSLNCRRYACATLTGDAVCADDLVDEQAHVTYQ